MFFCFFRNAFNSELINRFLSNSCSNIMNRWIENWSNSLVYLVKKYSSQININIRVDFPFNFKELPLNFKSVRVNSLHPFGEETRCVFRVYLTFFMNAEFIIFLRHFVYNRLLWPGHVIRTINIMLPNRWLVERIINMQNEVKSKVAKILLWFVMKPKHESSNLREKSSIAV